MKKLVNHVDAVFGGRQLRFELRRDAESARRLEAVVGSPSAAWGRFLTGHWTVADVRSVIALAHPVTLAVGAGDPFEAQHQEHTEAMELRAREMGVALPRRETVTERHGVEPEEIDCILSARPLATYSKLAGALLQAFMVGVPPALATFDERTALDEEQASLYPPPEHAGATA